MVRFYSRLVVTFLVLTPCLEWTAGASLLTPFRRGFGNFFGGRITRIDSASPSLQGLDFVDLGVDLPIETKLKGNKKQHFVRFHVRYERPQWSLTINGDPVDSDTASVTLDDHGSAVITLAAVSARGEVEELQARFESYDWDLFLEELDQEPKWTRHTLFYGILGIHSLTDTENSVTTYTPVNLSIPHGAVEWSSWWGKIPASRAWAWTLHADAGFTLPLQGQIWAPPFQVFASLQRRNLFRVPWHPGLRLRQEGFTQAAELLAPTGPATVTQSFTPRYTFVLWLDVFLEAEFEFSGMKLIAQFFGAHSVVGTSFRSDNMSSFLPGGWSGGAKARLVLPTPRQNWFATADFRYQALTSGSTSVLTDLGGELGFGYIFR